MSGGGQSAFAKHWRWWIGGSVLAGVGAICGLFAVAVQTTPSVIERPVAVATSSADATEAIEPVDVAGAAEAIPMKIPESSADEVAALAAEAAGSAQAAAAAPGVDPGPSHVFAAYSSDFQEGYWMDGYGQCYSAFGKSPMEMALNVEGKVGKRVSGVEWFDGGMSVVFRNGDKLAVWPTLIDCKDPPRDPYARKE